MFGNRVDANVLLYIILLVDMIEYGRLCVDVLRLETRGELTLDQALTFMESLGSAMGVSPPQFPLAPLARRAETPPTVSGFDSY